MTSFLPALLLLACADPSETDPIADLCSKDPPISWERFGQGHMRTHCNGCHGSQLDEYERNDAPPGVDFDTYAMVENWSERIYLRTLITQDMPPLGGPTEEELKQFEEWLVCEVLDGEIPE